MRKVYVVITQEGPDARFVEIETPEGASVRIEGGPYPGKEGFWRIGPLVELEEGRSLLLEGDDLWRVYDLVAARAETLTDASIRAMADVGGAPWERLQARLGQSLGRPMLCDCPKGGRYHALNCRYTPGELMRP